MSAPEPQVPSPPTWREYLDARLAVVATKDDVHAVKEDVHAVKDEIHAVEDRLRGEIKSDKRWIITTVISVGAVLAGLILRGV